MSDLQIREFIEDYQTAFNRLDAAAIAGFYDEPSAIVDRDRTAVFVEESSARENMTYLTQHYRAMGFTSVESERMRIERVSAEMAEVDVAWIMYLGEARLSFATRYWIVDRTEGPRIASVLAYGEKSAIEGSVAPRRLPGTDPIASAYRRLLRRRPWWN
jgi:hypothetical protein